MQTIPENNMQSTNSAYISNWKTYISKNCHISFDYPGDWQILSSFDNSEHGCIANFGVSSDSSEYLLFSTPAATTWQEIVKRYPDSNSTIIEGAEGLLNTDSKSSRFAIFHKGSVIFELGLVDVDGYQENDQRFDQIIDSVKLTGSESDYNKEFIPIIPITAE